MNRLDFLSKSPKTMIFGIKANQTNLGGVFTLIYLIIILLISIAYLFDFSTNSKYSVLYSYEHQYIHGLDNLDKRQEDKNLNPTINFNFDIKNVSRSHFFIVDASIDFQDPNIFSRFKLLGQDIETKLYDLNYFIIYFCADYENDKCVLWDEDKYAGAFNKFNLVFNYTGSKINHQNEETPLEKENICEIYDLVISDKFLNYELKWKNIKYIEEKGIFSRLGNLFSKTNNEFYGGEFITPKIATLDIPEEIKNPFFTILANFRVSNINQNHFDIYTRSKISIFDPISNICSLALTIYKILTFIFCGYYSNSFDNYKVMDNIIFKNKNIFSFKNNKEIELSSDLNEKNDLIIEKKENLIEDKNNIDSCETEEKEKIKFNKDTRILPKLHFYDFIFNNIYSKKCFLSKKQEIINTCNEIIAEYFTIDNIIYNQMKLENLFRDYKWNNPELNSIGNNKINYLFDNYS